MSTTNLSKLRRERMLAFLEKIREKHTDDESLIAINEIENELTEKKYGLVWEEHEEDVDVQMRDNIPVFTEVKDKEIESDENLPYNFLLEGDNLHSLKLLEKTHKGKIDLIYIDPPYNTGKEGFIYGDKYIDKEDAYRHSKWISFMYNRLNIAKNLLSQNGILFISIDDNELANLRLLCDSIFGEQNFVAILSIENNPKGRKNSNYVSICNDYCLIYAKDFKMGYFIENIPKDVKDLVKDENGNYVHNSGKRVLVGENRFNANVTNFSSDKHYTIYYNSTQNQIVIRKETDIETIDADLLKQGYARYFSYNENGFVYNTYTEQKIKDLFEDGKLDFKNGKIYEKNLSTKIRIKSIVTNRKYRAVLDNMEVDYVIDVKTTSAKTNLEQMLNVEKLSFSNPKNIGLIKLLISLIDSKDITVLDFFAGSGTTGHAVLNLNQLDNGNRKFILCTNNENNICENVTYQRIKTVITGMRQDGTTYSPSINANLKYYKTDFVPKISNDGDSFIEDKLLNHIAEMIQLEHAIKLDNVKYVLLLSDKQADDFINNPTNLEKCKEMYISSSVLLTGKQQQLIDKYDIITHIVPDYYFENELIEVDER